jgi:hypothetical protein
MPSGASEGGAVATCEDELPLLVGEEQENRAEQMKREIQSLLIIGEHFEMGKIINKIDLPVSVL